MQREVCDVTETCNGHREQHSTHRSPMSDTACDLTDDQASADLRICGTHPGDANDTNAGAEPANLCEGGGPAAQGALSRAEPLGAAPVDDLRRSINAQCLQSEAALTDNKA